MSNYGRDEEVYKAVQGAVVVSVAASVREKGEEKPDDVRLLLNDGRTLRLWLDGDCCSHSYYTDTAQLKELIGATIHGVEERDRETTENGEVSWHFLVFTTDRGHVTVDWRNDSNGYYDGSVHPVLVPAPTESK